VSAQASGVTPLQRLLQPRHIAVFGSRAAAEVVRQCRQLGFAGEIWPVHPHRDTLEGLRCFPSVQALPQAPDASFVAVPREATIEVVAALAARGAGGAICYASGFAEVGEEGAALQRQLVAAAGEMALLGPNCYGMLNYLDGVALWPDQHGAVRVERGVAIVTQSGNIGLNLTMQTRGLPLAALITVGNKAVTRMEDLVEALLQDNRISAIGLHIEGLDDVAAFSRVAIQALRQGVPLVALKAGSSDLGARITMSHTSSLAGPDALYDALFARCGVARVYEPAGLLETLKFLHVHGPLPGRRIISASCSGGEASLVADLAQARGLDMPALPAQAQARLDAVLGDKVNVANPLDYHTYIWGDLSAQTECFAGMLDCGFDAHLLVLDFPRQDRCDAPSWQTTVDAFVAASQGHASRAVLVSSLPEALPESVAQALLARGIAPMQGISDCLDAIAHAALIGQARARAQAGELQALPPVITDAATGVVLWSEARSKQALATYGLPVPRGAVVNAQQVVVAAESLGYPVVLKAVAEDLAHKSELGGVHLNLQDASQLQEAAASMANLADRFLVEEMAHGALVELIVGVQHDPQFGLSLTLGAGGIFVELLKDSVTLLLPVQPDEVRAALASLRLWPMLNGFRSRPVADQEALVRAILTITAFAERHAGRLRELDVNPLLVFPHGRGVMAVDALIRMSEEAVS
jgi:acyl-CoA synthetase (NDP forming)